MTHKRTDKNKDDWERFERAVDAAIKSGPKHKPDSGSRKSSSTQGRVRKEKAQD